MEPIRLNKYLSERGVLSRREADRAVEEGRILVNGMPSEKGQKVTDADAILLDGRPVSSAKPERVILAVHKPRGVVCTTRAFKGETNVVDLVAYPEKLYPVGRLDKESEGLIFLTNDGAFAKHVTDAGLRHEKEYEVQVNKDVTPHFLERMEKGVFLEELNRETSACRVEKIGNKRFRIVLTQGLNRQIRRMCETLGVQVEKLKRVRIMNVTLGDLEAGTYRKLGGEELKTLLKQSEKMEIPVHRKSYPKAAPAAPARKPQRKK